MAYAWRTLPNFATEVYALTVELPGGKLNRYTVRRSRNGERWHLYVNDVPDRTPYLALDPAKRAAERLADAAKRGEPTPVALFGAPSVDPAPGSYVLTIEQTGAEIAGSPRFAAPRIAKQSALLPPGDYCAVPKAVYDLETAELRSIADEVHAATAYIMEHGRMEIGTPQSKRLIQTVRRLKAMAKAEPKVPDDYPMNGGKPSSKVGRYEQD